MWRKRTGNDGDWPAHGGVEPEGREETRSTGEPSPGAQGTGGNECILKKKGGEGQKTQAQYKSTVKL